MLKIIKNLLTIVLVLSLFCLGALFSDKQSLRNGVVRLHVVANSDSEKDQQIKLRVRDTLLAYIEDNMPEALDAQSAKCFLNAHIGDLEDAANGVLSHFGNQRAKVTLMKESFGVREYDTFTLPSGVYDSLRVEIGNAEGKNWWCVIFPSFCTGACVEEFKEISVSSGFNDNLTNTLAEEDGYEIRFFFLDCLGKLENFFHIS